MNTQSDIQVNLKTYTCYVKKDCPFSTNKYDVLKRHTATHKNEDNIEIVTNTAKTIFCLSCNKTYKCNTKAYSPSAKKQNFNKKQKLNKRKIKWKVELLKDGDLDCLAVQDKRQTKWKVELLKDGDLDCLAVQDKRQTKWKVELLKDGDLDCLAVQDKRQTKWKVELLKDGDQDRLAVQDKRQTKWKVELLKDGGNQDELTVQDESDSHLNEANIVVTESGEDMISKLPIPDWAKEELWKTSGLLEKAKQWATLKKPTFKTCTQPFTPKIATSPSAPYQPPAYCEILPNKTHNNPGEVQLQIRGFPEDKESDDFLTDEQLLNHPVHKKAMEAVKSGNTENIAIEIHNVDKDSLANYKKIKSYMKRL